ncbi:MAG TPA: hypothetical protein PKI20_13520 [Verrucomicrobiota bacterium]|nr:hypothetical protein [Verrucomicrobiota bacterium]HQL78708.1 hypothetical protein [Verrucomicrobiota bacterium]
MSAKLTNRQKAYLAQLARQAWQRNPEADAQDAGTWRREQVARACGRLGLRCCSQDHYGAVKAHFLHLLGRDGDALRADLHSQTEANQRRIILWKIRKRCSQYGLGLEYADGICRRMTRGRGLQETEDTATLWNVYFKLDYYKTSPSTAG